jgi:integrase
MRLRLKGINRVVKTLADGSKRAYWYAWKGGPPLYGEPGTPEFIHSYNEACARKVIPPTGKLLSLLQGYQLSEDFTGLAEATRRGYVDRIRCIEAKFADFPLSALTDRRTRGIFMACRDKLAVTSRRQADYAWDVLARVLSWGLDRGLVLANPCTRGGRLYRGTRREQIWSADDETLFLQRAPVQLHLPLLLALWTGQRQGDLLRLPWSAYDGKHIRLKQSKTGARVVIPVGAPLKAALDAAPKRAPIILTIAKASRGQVTASARHGSAPASTPVLSGLRFTICAARRSPGLRLRDAPRPRLPPSPAIACAACARFWIRTTSRVFRPLPKVRLPSSNNGEIKWPNSGAEEPRGIWWRTDRKPT